MRDLGIDIGSISVKTALVDEHGNVVHETYRRHLGRPLEALVATLAEIEGEFPPDTILGVALTGTGAKTVAAALDLPYFNEITAQAAGTVRVFPHARSIVEIGGEDSKLIVLENGRIADFNMNSACAAGTGSFLDQQARRLGYDVETEFQDLALGCERPPMIAGRCSVFAKSDMIHLQQQATPDRDIVAGLCFALVRSFVATVVGGCDVRPPVSFQGGVASNRAIVHAMRRELGLDEERLVVPDFYRALGALGAVLLARSEEKLSRYPGCAAFDPSGKSIAAKSSPLAPLAAEPYVIVADTAALPDHEMRDAWIGVDIGSISTNVVAIDKDNRVLARRYLMTAGRPIEAVTHGLFEIGEEIGDRVVVRGVGTTGSGRHMIGHLIGADSVKNEITAHAAAAVMVDPAVDTILEIGGQDSKYTSLRNGAIADFAMNKVCAAGTGSFLEEQAEKLGISIRGEFGRLALAGKNPVPLGDRCTVFIESDLNTHLQSGCDLGDLAAGLAYSIVKNYLNRVVEKRRIGDRIFFQGGVAANAGVKAAFERVIGKKIVVPPHHDVMGAIGAALIAKDEKPGRTAFKGFDLHGVRAQISAFVCSDCPNSCELKKLVVDDGVPVFYGSRCGKFDEKEKSAADPGLPDVFRKRQRLLFAAVETGDRPKNKRIGIPLVHHFFEFLPKFAAFFEGLGIETVLSGTTTRKIARNGIDSVTAETCYPIKVAHGHVLELLEGNIDYLWLPSLVSLHAASDRFEHNFNCPWVQALPYMAASAIDFARYERIEVLSPSIHLERGPAHVDETLRTVARSIGIASASLIATALAKAHDAQNAFYGELRRLGADTLTLIEDDRPAVLIVSRSYNGCDPGLNFGIPDKLRALGVVAIPMDCLPLEDEIPSIAADYPDMYWKSGQRILAAARVARKMENLGVIYVSNFGCGPDSFIQKYFEREIGDGPHMVLELDEHSADTGVVTRLEAYIDSMRANARRRASPPPRRPRVGKTDELDRKILIPYMDDNSFAVAAAMRAHAVDAEVMPMANDLSVELGRRHSSGRECYPCIITTGDMIKATMADGFDPDRTAFFMPTANGPCRFGQYNRLQRMVLDELGFENVPIFVLDQMTEFGKTSGRLGKWFRLLAWKGVSIVDNMKRARYRILPYEKIPDATEAAYRQTLAELETAVASGADLYRFARTAARRFREIPVGTVGTKPRIGVIGEIFVRSNPFSNNFIADKLERLGAEVVMPTLSEWLGYTDILRMEDLKNDRAYVGAVREFVSRSVSAWVAGRIARNFSEIVAPDPSAGVIARYGELYLSRDVRGEAILSLGRAEELALAGCDGIVNVMPFNCMPGTIVNAIIGRLRKKHDNLPILKMSYDGNRNSGEETRIEAFFQQVKERMNCKTAVYTGAEA